MLVRKGKHKKEKASYQQPSVVPTIAHKLRDCHHPNSTARNSEAVKSSSHRTEFSSSWPEDNFPCPLVSKPVHRGIMLFNVFVIMYLFQSILCNVYTTLLWYDIDYKNMFSFRTANLPHENYSHWQTPKLTLLHHLSSVSVMFIGVDQGFSNFCSVGPL